MGGYGGGEWVAVYEKILNKFFLQLLVPENAPLSYKMHIQQRFIFPSLHRHQQTQLPGPWTSTGQTLMMPSFMLR